MLSAFARRSGIAICGAVLFAARCGALADAPQNATWRPPTTVDRIPFVNGSLSVPTTPSGPNNRGVITDQTLPGMTHIETYLLWNLLEPRKDEWNTAELDQLLALSAKYGLKTLVLPCITTPPDWFKQTGDYVPEVDSATGKSVDVMSPWAPGTYAAYEHFYASLARTYGSRIDIVKFAFEIGMRVGVDPGTLLAESWGYMCGDTFARADFRDRMLAKHGSLARLNAAWGTHYASASAIAYPSPSARAKHERQWVDFLTWYRDSATRAMVRQLRIIRKHFATQLIDIPMGYGSDLASDGCDRTGVIEAAAAFKPVSIRSTHGSFNRNQYPQAYWFYKRMAPTCHRLGVGFGTEPPGGDLTYAEIRRQLFEDASAGANFIFHYYQNYHLTPRPNMEPRIVAEYKRLLRPAEKPLVDIGVLYPTTHAMLDLTGHPDGQLQFCSEARANVDYDLVDENMVRWGELGRYKVLIHTSGAVFGAGVLSRIAQWLEAGGALVTRGAPNWREVGATAAATRRWLAHEDTSAGATLAARGASGVRAYRLGKGTVYSVASADVTDFVRQVACVLASTGRRIHGYTAFNGGAWTTEFPSGHMVYDLKTQETTFVRAGH